MPIIVMNADRMSTTVMTPPDGHHRRPADLDSPFQYEMRRILQTHLGMC